MKMSRTSWIMALTAMAMIATAPHATAKTKIRIGTQAPKGTAWMKAMSDISKKVAKKTKGKVQFKFFPNGTLGDEKVVINRMKTNEIDGGLFTGIGLGQIQPDIRVLELPLFYKPGSGEIEKVRTSLESKFIEGFEKQGYVFLGWSEVGWAYVFSKSELPNLTALRQKKIWFWQDDPLAENAMKVFELKGVPLALTDVLTSLNSGMIDTVYNSPYGLVGLQWHNKVKFMSRINVGHGTGALLITRRVFNKIPAKYRKSVLSICRKRCAKLLEEVKAENLKAEKELQAQGVKFYPVADSDTNTLNELAEKLANSMAGKIYSKEMLASARKIVAESRSGKADEPGEKKPEDKKAEEPKKAD